MMQLDPYQFSTQSFHISVTQDSQSVRRLFVWRMKNQAATALPLPPPFTFWLCYQNATENHRLQENYEGSSSAGVEFFHFLNRFGNTLVMWWVSQGVIFSLNTVEEQEDLLELHASASDSLWINQQTGDWIGMLLLSVCHMIPEACLLDRVAWTSSPSSVAIGFSEYTLL
jgi:hypothetical protein